MMVNKFLYFLTTLAVIMFIAGYEILPPVVNGDVVEYLIVAATFRLFAELVFMIFLTVLSVSLGRSPMMRALFKVAPIRAVILVGQLLRYLTTEDSSPVDDSVFPYQFFLLLSFGSAIVMVVASRWRWTTAAVARARGQGIQNIGRQLAMTVLVMVASTMMLLLGGGDPDQIDGLSSEYYLFVNFTILVLASVVVVLSVMRRGN